MAGSDPELRERILSAVHKIGHVEADTLRELKYSLGLGTVSNTQFDKALRSLHFKYGGLWLSRPRLANSEVRIYQVRSRMGSATQPTFMAASA